jgi:hypothetical protein
MRSNQSLPTDRVETLNKVGFVWDAKEEFWNEMLAALIEYKAAHGHCNVPTIWPHNPKLAVWVGNQRRLQKRGKLGEARINQMDEIGFTWDPYEAAWEEMFAALVEYKSTHADCKVPYNWPENPKLGKWVNKQRTTRNQQRLSVDRIRRLDELGFEWSRNEKRAKSVAKTS